MYMLLIFFFSAVTFLSFPLLHFFFSIVRALKMEHAFIISLFSFVN